MPFEEYLGYYQQTILHLFIRKRENEELSLSKIILLFNGHILFWKKIYQNTQFILPILGYIILRNMSGRMRCIMILIDVFKIEMRYIETLRDVFEIGT